MKHFFPLFFLILFASPVTRAEPVAGQDPQVTGLLNRLKETPGDYRLNLRLGARYAALGKIANAEAAYRRAMAAAPDSREPSHALCLLYLAHRRDADALAVADAWLAKDPQSYYGRLCRAEALRMGGDSVKSLGVLAELHRHYPSDLTVLKAMKARHAELGQAAELDRVSRLIAEIETPPPAFAATPGLVRNP